MKFKKLSSTSELIPVVGMGMGIGGYMAKNAVYTEEHAIALRQGIDLGMILIDTSEEYGNGDAEIMIGKVVRNIRNKIFIAGKVSSGNLSCDRLISSAEASLRRLGTDYIDLYQIHWPNPNISMGETMQAMEKLISDGKIRYIGVCNFSLKELREAQSSLKKDQIVSVQAEYSLYERSVENGMLAYCEEKDITFIAYSPLAQGRISSGNKAAGILKDIANKYNKTIAQIALNWLISHPAVVVIPKATRLDHIKENSRASDFELSKDDFNRISDVFNQRVVNIPTEKIRVIYEGRDGRRLTQTLADILENKPGFVPSASDLARGMRGSDILKPVRVAKTMDALGNYDYDLIEGRLRYWAWVIAHNGERPIPAYVMNIKIGRRQN